LNERVIGQVNFGQIVETRKVLYERPFALLILRKIWYLSFMAGSKTVWMWKRSPRANCALLCRLQSRLNHELI